jgi:hypothetical protein
MGDSDRHGESTIPGRRMGAARWQRLNPFAA